MNNPFRVPGSGLNVRSIRNALSDIKNDIEDCQALLEQYERNTSMDNEIVLSINLSGLEIKQTNFAKDLREAFQ